METTTVVATVIATIVLVLVGNRNVVETRIFPLLGIKRHPVRVKVRSDVRKRR